MGKFFILFIFVFGVFNLYASETTVLTEDGAVDLALKQNLSLKNSHLDLESAIEQEKNKWNNYIPGVNLSSGLSKKEKFLSDDGNSSPWALSISSGLSFSLGAYTPLNAKRTEISLRNQELSYISDEKALEVSIRKQFKYLQASKENLTLQEKNIDLAKKRYEQAKINYSNGLISELDLLTSQNSYESLKPEYQDADTTYKQLEMSFMNSLGINFSNKLELVGNLDVEHYDFNSDLLVLSFLANRLDVNANLLKVELEENQLAITIASSKTPSLSLSATWSNSVSDVFEDSAWADGITMSATVNIPIDAYILGSSENLDIKDAQRSVEQSRLSLESTISDAEEDIRSIIMELEGAWANIETTELSVKLAQKTYEMTEKAFQKGTSELLDLEDAQNKLLEANQNLLLSKYTYLSGMLDLEYALNTEIENIKKVSVEFDKNKE